MARKITAGLLSVLLLLPMLCACKGTRGGPPAEAARSHRPKNIIPR